MADDAVIVLPRRLSIEAVMEWFMVTFPTRDIDIRDGEYDRYQRWDDAPRA